MQTVDRKVLKTFQGEGENTLYERRSIVKLDPQKARDYDNQGLTTVPDARPSRAAALASVADNKAQAAKAAAEAAKASETKETTGKGANGLEPWDGAQSPEAYVSRFDGKDNSPEVAEKLKLAKAHVKAAAKG